MSCFNRMVEMSFCIALLSASGLGLAEAGTDEWTSHGPEYAITVLAIDPLTPSTLYAGTSAMSPTGVPGAGVFKSTNGGGSWSAAGLTSRVINTLAIDPRTPTTLYAAAYPGGVFKTIDGGTSWTAVNTGLDLDLPRLVVNSLAIDPQTPATLYAGTPWGVFKSTNGAATWSAVNNGLPRLWVDALAVDPLTPTTLYAGGNGRVFKSANGGGNWSDSGLFADQVHALVIDPLTPTILYAGTLDGVSRSTDGAATWSPARSDFTTGLAPGQIEALAIDPETPTTLYAGNRAGGGVFKSMFSGENWNAMNSGLTNLDVTALVIDPVTPSILYAGTQKGVFAYRTGGLSLAFRPNRPAFTSGETLHLDLMFENSGGATGADVYFGALLPAAAGPDFGCPRRDAIVFVADNFTRSITTCLSAPQNLAPLAASLPIAAGIPPTLVEKFFSFVWPPNAPPGIYTFFLGLMSPGTLNFMSLAQTSVNLSP
jgi:photosystem II stability/assembly factor-like uncharacterized protein